MMRAASRLAGLARRHLLRRSDSEGPARIFTASPPNTSPAASPIHRALSRSSTAAMSTAVSAPSSPLHVALEQKQQPLEHTQRTVAAAACATRHDRGNNVAGAVIDDDDYDDEGLGVERAAESEPLVGDLFAGLDPTQIALMKEQCILVDEDDRVVGSGSKKDCHLMTNINSGLLHRAFSVFLFNSAGELLIQQRSDAKITFPGCFTNTCCSHPLATPSELTANPVEGIKRAAQRRMHVELGIPPEELPLSCFRYLTRIQYLAASNGGAWGEHEIDYILFVQKDVNLIRPNPNEIKAVRFLAKKDVESFIRDLEERGEPLTPWFRLILNTFLMKWWDNLDRLHEFESHDRVHKLS